MLTQTVMQQEPLLRPINNGWLARGDQWAVIAPTREGAVQRYQQRCLFYQALDEQIRLAHLLEAMKEGEETV